MNLTPVAGPMPAAPKPLAAVVAAFVLLLLAVAAPAARADAVPTGGASYVAPEPVRGRAILSPDGRTAVAPSDAPSVVRAAVTAANRIVRKPYRYGGGHGRLVDTGYDCSGTVSFALAGAGLLTTPLDSSSFMAWGRRGKGRWISVYSNPGHAYAVIAGLRLDTSGPGESGPRWRPTGRSARGFLARHPAGL